MRENSATLRSIIFLIWSYHRFIENAARKSINNESEMEVIIIRHEACSVFDNVKCRSKGHGVVVCA